MFFLGTISAEIAVFIHKVIFLFQNRWDLRKKGWLGEKNLGNTDKTSSGATIVIKTMTGQTMCIPSGEERKNMEASQIIGKSLFCSEIHSFFLYTCTSKSCAVHVRFFSTDNTCKNNKKNHIENFLSGILSSDDLRLKPKYIYC